MAFLKAGARSSRRRRNAPARARPVRHRDRKGLRRRQTLVRRSGFADRKTQPRRGSSGGDGSAGRAASRSHGAPIGPPSQHVSRIAPQVRHMSLARISKVSPWQMGQRPVLMGRSIRNGRRSAQAAGGGESLGCGRRRCAAAPRPPPTPGWSPGEGSVERGTRVPRAATSRSRRGRSTGSRRPCTCTARRRSNRSSHSHMTRRRRRRRPRGKRGPTGPTG